MTAISGTHGTIRDGLYEAPDPSAFHLTPDAIVDRDGLIIGYEHALEDAEAEAARTKRALLLNLQLCAAARPGSHLRLRKSAVLQAAIDGGAIEVVDVEAELLEKIEEQSAEIEELTNLLVNRELSAPMQHTVEVMLRSAQRSYDRAISKLDAWKGAGD